MPGLQDIPFLSGYLATQQSNQQQGLNELKQAGGLMGLLGEMQKQQQAQQAAQREAQFRSGLRPDMTPEQRLAHAAQFMGPEALGRMDQGHLDREAGRTATAENARLQRESIAENARLQREAQAHNIQLQGQQAIERVREAERERRITKEEADRREAGMRESITRLIAQLRPAPQPQPLVPIVGPGGEPTLATREEAHGKTPWAAGSAIEARNTGKQQLKDTVDRLAASYDNLEKQGAVISPTQNALRNVWERTAASGPGQFVAGAVGTKAQTERDMIGSARASLMAALKSATGLSAQQLNSNAELNFYMQMATDPTKSVEANRDALAYFDKTYGLGLGITGDPARIAPARQSTSGAIGAPRQERRAKTVKFGDLK
jgi:hypothetical protein